MAGGATREKKGRIHGPPGAAAVTVGAARPPCILAVQTRHGGWGAISMGPREAAGEPLGTS